MGVVAKKRWKRIGCFHEKFVKLGVALAEKKERIVFTEKFLKLCVTEK